MRPLDAICADLARGLLPLPTPCPRRWRRNRRERGNAPLADVAQTAAYLRSRGLLGEGQVGGCQDTRLARALCRGDAKALGALELELTRVHDPARYLPPILARVRAARQQLALEASDV